MSQANAYEQYMLELINIERAKVGAQPLAFDEDLNESAEGHSKWMIATDTFSHTGAGGSTPVARMKAAGYEFSGSWAAAENIGWASTRAPAGLQDEVSLLHTNLMNSAGHRANLLNANFREVGIGFEVGQYGSYEGAFVTQNFAVTASKPFLTGVLFDDMDGDLAYDVGEGLGNLLVSAKNTTTGVVTSFTTTPAGGYALELPSGGYTVTFSGGGYSATKQVTIGTRNVKLDLVDPVASIAKTITGSEAGEGLGGTTGNDAIRGLGGNDSLYGGGGTDFLEGGSGNDLLSGGAGMDTLTGGAGADVFFFSSAFRGAVDRVTDFSPVDDTIRLENGVFTTLPSGALQASAFHAGAVSHDSTDRVLYDAGSGALYYDPDGTGAAAAEQFGQVAPGLSVTHADFSVV